MEHKENILDTIEIRDVFNLVRKNKVIFSLLIIIFLLFALYINYSTVPLYKSKAVIMIDNAAQTQQFIGLEQGFNQMSIKNEIEIIKSQSLAKAVIDSLIRTPQKSDLYALGTKVYIYNILPFTEIIKKVLSLGFYTIQIDETNIDFNENINKNKYTYINRLKNNVSIYSKRNTDLLEISYSSPSKKEAVYINNLIIAIYKNFDRKWKNFEQKNLTTFLNNQFITLSEELKEIEKEIKIYQEKNQTIDFQNLIINKSNSLFGFEEKYNLALAEKIVLQKNISELNALLDSSQLSLFDDLKNTSNPRINELRRNLAEKEILFSKNQGNISLVNQIQKEIEKIKRELENETKIFLSDNLISNDPLLFNVDISNQILFKEIELNQINTIIKHYKESINTLNQEISQLPDKVQYENQLKRKKITKEKLLDLLNNKIEENNIAQASLKDHIRIIDSANSVIKIKPDKSRNIMLSIFLAIALAFIISILIEYFDQSISSVSSIQLLGSSVLGVIPKIGQISTKNWLNLFNSNKTKDVFIDRIIAHLDPLNPISEAYRSIRTNISYAKPNETINSMIVSSPGPSEGKTTTAINLAITFSQLGKKTLIVDTDLRKPIVHKIFNLKRKNGISEYLSSNNHDFDLNSMIKTSNIKNLSIITSGKIYSNPSELLGSPKMKNLINQLKERFDMVIFDSPPIIAVTDSRVIANDVDALVLVVKSGQTNKHHLNRTLSLLKSVNAPHIGCILNGYTHY